MNLKKFLVPAVMGLMCLTAASRPAHADLVTYFDFSNYSGSGTSVLSVDPLGAPVADQTTTLTLNTGGGGAFVSATNLLDVGVIGTTVDTKALAYVKGFGAPTNANIQFGVNLSGFRDPIFTYAAARVDTNLFEDINLSYSLDNGLNFTSISNTIPNTAVTLPVLGLYNYDLGPLNDLDGAANVIFRLDGFANVNASTTVFDSISINATPNAVPTPEPETWAMMGLGMAAVAFMGWKRRKGQMNMDASEAPAPLAAA